MALLLKPFLPCGLSGCVYGDSDFCDFGGVVSFEGRAGVDALALGN
jgi:hypothetical protein